MVGTSHGGLTRAFVERGGGVSTALFLTRDLGTVLSWSNPLRGERATSIVSVVRLGTEAWLDAARAAHLGSTAPWANWKSASGSRSGSGCWTTRAAESARTSGPAPRRWLQS